MGYLKIPTKNWLLMIVLSPQPITIILASLSFIYLVPTFLLHIHLNKQSSQNNPIHKLILLPFALLFLIKKCNIPCCYILCTMLILLLHCNVSSMKTSLHLGCPPFYSQFLLSTWYIVGPQIHLLKELKN